MRIRLAALVTGFLAVPAVLPSPAAAQPVAYTFTMTGTGTLGASPFTRQTLTVQATGDLSGVSAPGVEPAAILGLPATLTVPGLGSFAVTSPVYVFNATRPTFGVAGFGATSDYLQVHAAALMGYDLLTDVGPITASTGCPDALGTVLPCIGGNVTIGAALATGGGELTFSSIEAASFTARVGVVPEPSTVALLGGGLAVLGAAARRRRVAAQPR